MADHFETTKTLHQLQDLFYWPVCDHVVELYVHWHNFSAAEGGVPSQKEPIQHYHASMQKYQLQASMERVSVDILGPFPTTHQEN